jgi:hypothetical protein
VLDEGHGVVGARGHALLMNVGWSGALYCMKRTPEKDSTTRRDFARWVAGVRVESADWIVGAGADESRRGRVVWCEDEDEQVSDNSTKE